MILAAAAKSIKPTGILHVCGDDPINLLCTMSDLKVFSTYVEMIL